MQTKKMNIHQEPATASNEEGLTVAEHIILLQRLAADERFDIRDRLTAERELLDLRLAAAREAMLPEIVSMLQDAARNAESRDVLLAFAKALARIWDQRPDLRPIPECDLHKKNQKVRGGKGHDREQ